MREQKLGSVSLGSIGRVKDSLAIRSPDLLPWPALLTVTCTYILFCRCIGLDAFPVLYNEDILCFVAAGITFKALGEMLVRDYPLVCVYCEFNGTPDHLDHCAKILVAAVHQSLDELLVLMQRGLHLGVVEDDQPCDLCHCGSSGGTYHFTKGYLRAAISQLTESVSNVQTGTGAPWYLLDLSKAMKPIIWQEREAYEFQSITNPNDAHVFMSDEYVYGIRARVNCGFGLWQLAYGARSDLNSENFALARQSMSLFTGDEGQKLGITPTHLIVPPALEAKARTLLMADQIEGSSNIWKGTAELIVSPWLN